MSKAGDAGGASQSTISKFFLPKGGRQTCKKTGSSQIGSESDGIPGPSKHSANNKGKGKRSWCATSSSEDTPKQKKQRHGGDNRGFATADEQPVVGNVVSRSRSLSEDTLRKLQSFNADCGYLIEGSGRASNISAQDLKRPASGGFSYDGDICKPGCDTVTVSDDGTVPDTPDKGGKSSYSQGSLSSRFGNSQKKPSSVAEKSLTPGSGERTHGGRNKNKYTPLELQVLEIRDKYPDVLLLVECGYKYRFFGDDAEIAAKELNIFAHPDHNFMTASIPVHRLFVHVRRLVAKGYKVGVVKQMEMAALKAAGDNRNAPFNRQLTALYTKSTLIGEDVDPVNSSTGDANEGGTTSSSSSYLMCVYEPVTKETAGKSHKVAIIAIQPATGDVVYECFEDGPTRAELETRVTQIQPAELLLPTTLSQSTEKVLTQLAKISYSADDRMRVERHEDDMFNPDVAVKGLADLFNMAAESSSSNKENGGSTNSGGLSELLQLPQPVVCCLHGLMTYLREFNLHYLLRLSSNFREFSCGDMYMSLPASTLRNLEVFNNLTDGKVKGSLIWILDHTCTKFGSRLLRQWLAKPLMDISAINARLDAVTELLSTDAAILCKLRDMLPRLPDLDRGLATILHRKSSTAGFLTVCKSLQQIYQALEPFASSSNCCQQSVLLSSILSELPCLLDGIQEWVNAINERAAKDGDKTKIFTDESSYPAILGCKQAISDVLGEIHEHRRDVRRMLHQPALEYNTVSGMEFLIEVRNNQLKNVPSDWSKISSTKAVSRFHSPFIVSAMKKLSQLRERLILESETAWQEFLRSFENCYPRYRQAVNLVAQFDCLVSMATVAKQDGYCRPEVVDAGSQIHIEQGRHPVVAALLAENAQYVPNNTQLQASDERCMIITGPNMGGKSSYIRQVALITLLAQVGCCVPAESARVGLVDAIYTRMGAFDELFQGRSTFMVELQEASDIISKATARSLVIMDELGRGTSTHDGVAIAHATLVHFILEVKCMTLFVTHYPSLAELEHVAPDNVANFHMSFLVHEQGGQEDFENNCDDTQAMQAGPANSDQLPDLSSGDSITFLYQLVPGMAARSYGLNVAQLANLPSDVVSVATCKSRELEDNINLKRKREEFFRQLFQISTSNVNAIHRKLVSELENVDRDMAQELPS